MNTEDIKYCIEEFKPVGIKIDNSCSFDYIRFTYVSFMCSLLSREKDSDSKRLWISDYNSLFLQRVIEGINKDFLNSEIKSYYINIDTHIMIMDRMGIPRHDFKAKPVTEENKEKAIKYVIDQLRSVRA